MFCETLANTPAHTPIHQLNYSFQWDKKSNWFVALRQNEENKQNRKTTTCDFNKNVKKEQSECIAREDCIRIGWEK